MDARPVGEKDELLCTQDTRPVKIRHTVAGWDAVRHIEADSAIVTRSTDIPVSSGAVLRGTPRAVLEDDVPVAFDAPPAVTASA